MRLPTDLGWGSHLVSTLSPPFHHQAIVCRLGRVPAPHSALCWAPSVAEVHEEV